MTGITRFTAFGRAAGLAASTAITLAAMLHPADAAGPNLTILHDFVANDSGGYGPSGGLVFGNNGVLYGTTPSGSTGNGGTLFSLTPPVSPSTTWAFDVLHIFGLDTNDGKGPEGGLIMDTDGAIYGTTVFGPSLVYKLSPPVAPKKRWTEAFLHLSVTNSDAVTPYDGVIADATGAAGTVGALYGTSSRGGGTDSACTFGCGTIYQLLPPAEGKRRWVSKIIYRFQGGATGWNPTVGLVMDSDGVLYGVTGNGGSTANGVVFSLSPPAPPSKRWRYRVLHDFLDGTDGGLPAGRLILVNGDLYGVTDAHSGTVFKLKRPAPSKPHWKLATLYHFQGFSDGSLPNNQLLPGPNGSFYGTTFAGGQNSCGTVYQLMPPAAHSNTWTKTILHDFGGTQLNDGCSPSNFGLIPGSDGALYGATSSGGAGNAGTIYQLIP